LIRVLIDENVPVSVIEWLKNRGLSVQRISEVGLKGVNDEEVARYAIKNGMAIRVARCLDEILLSIF